MTAPRTLLAVALLLAAPARAAGQAAVPAEGGKKAPARAGTPAPRAKGEDPKGEAGKVFRLEEMEVKGKVQKPAVLSITPPAAALASDAPSDESFIPRILEAAERPPF